MRTYPFDATLQAGHRFVCGWKLRNGRTVAVLHYSPDPAGYTIKADGFGSWMPHYCADAAAIAAATDRVRCRFPHAKIYKGG